MDVGSGVVADAEGAAEDSRRKAAESADMTFFYFGEGGGGEVQANAQRWAAQFHGPEGATKIEEEKIAGMKVTLVSSEGAFSSGMPGGPSTVLENYALLGAIIEDKDGNVFVKMTGPAALVKQSRKKFPRVYHRGDRGAEVDGTRNHFPAIP